MIFGHNTNVSAGSVKYHVQTENAGGPTALIDTVVYAGGRVLHRRTSNYLDLLPLDEGREATLKQRLDDQHRQVLEEVRSGVLHLPATATPHAPIVAPAAKIPENSAVAAPGPSGRESPQTGLRLELLNPRNWLTAKQASLHLRVTDFAGNPVDAAQLHASLAGSSAMLASVESAGNGEAFLNFEMPRVDAANSTLLLAAEKGAATCQISFQLRVKQRVPTS